MHYIHHLMSSSDHITLYNITDDTDFVFRTMEILRNIGSKNNNIFTQRQHEIIMLYYIILFKSHHIHITLFYTPLKLHVSIIRLYFIIYINILDDVITLLSS